MGTSLKDIAMDLGTVQVVVNGKTITLRRLSARDQREARAHMPAPTPPRTKKDPTKGDLADRLPDEDDPGYRAAAREYLYNVQAIELAIALDLELSDGKRWCPGIAAGGATAQAFAVQAREELERAWDAQTIERVYSELTAGSTPAGDASGN